MYFPSVTHPFYLFKYNWQPYVRTNHTIYKNPARAQLQLTPIFNGMNHGMNLKHYQLYNHTNILLALRILHFTFIFLMIILEQHWDNWSLVYGNNGLVTGQVRVTILILYGCTDRGDTFQKSCCCIWMIFMFVRRCQGLYDDFLNSSACNLAVQVMFGDLCCTLQSKIHVS